MSTIMEVQEVILISPLKSKTLNNFPRPLGSHTTLVYVKGLKFGTSPYVPYASDSRTRRMPRVPFVMCTPSGRSIGEPRRLASSCAQGDPFDRGRPHDVLKPPTMPSIRSGVFNRRRPLFCDYRTCHALTSVDHNTECRWYWRVRQPLVVRHGHYAHRLIARVLPRLVFETTGNNEHVCRDWSEPSPSWEHMR